MGFFLIIAIGGVVMELTHGNPWLTMVGMAVGVAADYALGTGWFMLQTGSTLAHALDVCVYPFIPFDLGKIVLGVPFGLLIRKSLEKAGLR